MPLTSTKMNKANFNQIHYDPSMYTYLKKVFNIYSIIQGQQRYVHDRGDR